MTDHEYRTLPRVANSDLSELAAIGFNKQRWKVKPETLSFGTLFHALVLEPNRREEVLLHSDLTNNALIPLWFMEESVRNCTDLNMIIQSAQCEAVREWECSVTGLALKARLDIVVEPRRIHLIDLKTTSCRSKAEFIDKISEYDYDRQAAFYLDSDPKAKFFEFAGVQKIPPYALFRVPLHRTSDTIANGRKKMLQLLKLAKQEFDRPDGWRPSSWTRSEQL